MTDALLDVLTAQPSYGPALRRLICELAIAGRLLPQTSKWTEYRLEEIVSVRGGSTPSMARPEYWGGDVPWVSPKDMHVGDIVTSEMFVTQEALERTTLELVPLGSVLIVGRSGILKRKLPAQVTRVACTVNQDIKALTPKRAIESAYLRLWLLGSERSILAEDVKTGTTVQSLVFSKLFARRVRLPSTAEQRQIVAKVDELMALCDRLEAEQADAEAAHAKLVEALLASLTQARDAADFRASWQQLAEHFHTLFTTEASVDALEEAIRELAVSGRLTEQYPADGTSDGLIAEIDGLRATLVAEEGLRTGARSDVPVAERYLKVPMNWRYCRLGNLARFIDYRGKTPVKTSSGVPLITAKNVRFGYISREPREFIAAEGYAPWMTRGIPRAGDMLFTTEAPLGNIAIIDVAERFALAQRVICFQLHRMQTGPFLRIALMSKSVQAAIAEMATGMTATGVKAAKLKELPIPLPPLAEQKRIVENVERLMKLCAYLRTEIANSRQHHEHLASVLVEQAVA